MSTPKSSTHPDVVAYHAALASVAADASRENARVRRRIARARIALPLEREEDERDSAPPPSERTPAPT